MSSAPGSAQPSTYMRAEIMQQPAALRATIDALLPRAAEAGGWPAAPGRCFSSRAAPQTTPPSTALT